MYGGAEPRLLVGDRLSPTRGWHERIIAAHDAILESDDVDPELKGQALAGDRNR